MGACTSYGWCIPRGLNKALRLDIQITNREEERMELTPESIEKFRVAECSLLLGNTEPSLLKLEVETEVPPPERVGEQMQIVATGRKIFRFDTSNSGRAPFFCGCTHELLPMMEVAPRSPTATPCATQTDGGDIETWGCGRRSSIAIRRRGAYVGNSFGMVTQ